MWRDALAFVRLNNTPLCVETNFYPFICWQTFTLLPPSNTVKILLHMNMDVQISLWHLVFNSFGERLLLKKKKQTPKLSTSNHASGAAPERPYPPSPCSSCHQITSVPRLLPRPFQCPPGSSTFKWIQEVKIWIYIFVKKTRKLLSFSFSPLLGNLQIPLWR